MTRSALNEAYFDWMYYMVTNNEPDIKKRSYHRLLRHLHSIDFSYIIPMDGNRAEDGINLRYRFGYGISCSQVKIANYLDDRPCSVLEMLVALSIRCEEQIMEDTDIGDRTGQWFWTMIYNLCLNTMYDTNFDEAYVDYVIQRFLNREYDRNGFGGLFVVDNGKDMRSVEIWYQMCWFLATIT